jgi:hypothetical protein
LNRDPIEPIAVQPLPGTHSPYRHSTRDAPKDWWITTLRGFSIMCFVAAIEFLAKGQFASSDATHTSIKPTAASISQPSVTTRNIEDCDVGQRALGRNPLRRQVEMLPEPDPKTSRKLVLRMRKESGHRLDIRLIRSLSWLETVGAIQGESFFLNLEEMGAVGDAYVETILPCPPIEKGEGNVITGVFAHEATVNAY